MKAYSDMVKRIIEEQSFIIGPIAWQEAKKIDGLDVDPEAKVAEIRTGVEEKKVLDMLVEQYTKLFGEASLEVCKNAVGDILATMPVEKIPSQLK